MEERIQFLKEESKDEEIFELLHPLVREWFKNKYGKFSPPQKYAIKYVHSRENILISSPTGSGKTLSAFLAIISELVSLADKNLLEDKIYAIYISPLRALANDMRKNLLEPLSEIKELGKKKGKEIEIKVGIRTGDTPSNEKAKMLRKPPHILITTPESLAIMLTAPKFREKLAEVEWVIVDELHALAENKRGTHLSLSLERLANETYFARIGLSATIAPLKEVAKFLVGYENPDLKIPRPCKIVDVSFAKPIDLKVLTPVDNLLAYDIDYIHHETYKLIDELVQKHRTTLIFTNTRSGTERVVHHLKTKFPKNYTYIEDVEEDVNLNVEARSLVAAHHSSLSRDLRFNIEQQLKEGKLKVVVSSTSLELGIDIGYIDLVILLGSPKSVARLLQRTGRSGHKLHETSIGRIIVMDRDDLVECAVMVKEALEKKIDRIHIPMSPLDVLAQQIVGMAMTKKWNVDELYSLVRRAYPYVNLPKIDFMRVIYYLSGTYKEFEERNVYAKIWYDPDTNEIGKKGKLTRMIFMTNVGTIPDETFVKVKLGKQTIGYIDEEFFERLRKGDVFVLGGETYEFLYSRGMNAYVKTSVDRPPTIPSWFSEMLPLNFDLAMAINKFRALMLDYFKHKKSKEDIISFLQKYLKVDFNAANSIYEYFKEQYLFAKIPTHKKIVIEIYKDKERKLNYYIFHTLFGRRTNDALSRAVAYVAGKISNADVEIGLNDNGFYLLSDSKLQAKKALLSLKEDNIQKILEEALEKTEIMYRRFRHVAARGLMILRSYRGKVKSVNRQQNMSKMLLRLIQKVDPDFPLLKETKREILEDVMDITHAKEIVKKIQEGEIEIDEIVVPFPSPFAWNLVSQGYYDIVKIKDRQEFLRELYEKLQREIKNKKV